MTFCGAKVCFRVLSGKLGAPPWAAIEILMQEEFYRQTALKIAEISLKDSEGAGILGISGSRTA